MSDWSSFEKDKAYIDQWRQFAKGEIVEEGLFDKIKGFVSDLEQKGAIIQGREKDNLIKKAELTKRKLEQELQIKIDAGAIGDKEKKAYEEQIKELEQKIENLKNPNSNTDSGADASGDNKSAPSGVDLSRPSKDPKTALQQAYAILNSKNSEFVKHMTALLKDQAISEDLYKTFVKGTRDTGGFAGLVDAFIEARYGRASTAGTRAEENRLVLTLAANMAPNKQFQSVFQRLANRVSALFKEQVVLNEVGSAADMITSMAYYLDRNHKTWKKKGTQTKPGTTTTTPGNPEGEPETAITTRTDGTPTTTGGGQRKPGQQKLLPLNIFTNDIRIKGGRFVFQRINKIQPPEDKQYIVFHEKDRVKDRVDEKIDVSELDLLHPDHENDPSQEYILRKHLPKIQAYIDKKVAEIKDQIPPEAVEALTDYLYGFDKKKEQGLKQIGTQERYPFSELLEQAREAEVKEFDTVFELFTEGYRKQLGDRQSGEAQALIKFVEQVSDLIEANSREVIEQQITQFQTGKYDDLGYGNDKDNPVTVINQILDILKQKLGEPEEEPEYTYSFNLDNLEASDALGKLRKAWNSKYENESGFRFESDIQKFANFVGPYVNYDKNNAAAKIIDKKANKVNESNRFRKEMKKIELSAPGYWLKPNEFSGALIKKVNTDESIKRIMLSLLRLSGGRFVRNSIQGVLKELIGNLQRRKKEKQVKKESVIYDRMKLLAGIK